MTGKKHLGKLYGKHRYNSKGARYVADTNGNFIQRIRLGVPTQGIAKALMSWLP